MESRVGQLPQSGSQRPIPNTLLTQLGSPPADGWPRLSCSETRFPGRVIMGEESVNATAVRSFDDAIATRTAKIGIIGLGYAGLPLAVGFANSGFPVLGIDLDPDRVKAVNAGR